MAFILLLILLLHDVHLSSKPNTSALKQVLGGCHGYKVTLWAWPSIEVFPFSFSGKMKMHVAKLSEPSFCDFKARLHPGELRDLSQMAVAAVAAAAAVAGCIPSALLTFTICLSDLRNKESQVATFENRCALISPIM